MHSQHSVAFCRGISGTCSCIRRSDREQCLPFKVGATAARGVRLIGLFGGRVIAAIAAIAAAVKEEDFALACVRAWAADLARLRLACAEILPVCERSESE